MVESDKHEIRGFVPIGLSSYHAIHDQV